ncbi:lipopolysaccharide biosynthesis protein [Pseudoalteromonas tunicata]|uniref:lipopolysaccharide biosynthesis protein n=1 Tax=Pseudoalteromonas tunicata TaxID=314281 RepID=UPI00273FDAE2|nr:lipopolysaccharide biosynthesis protein [Pseudoalteromonas tunicata]MDP4985717.1 lipopolysaccharide biosynthesis protein [Pseudoalteromonas tunicata]
MSEQNRHSVIKGISWNGLRVAFQAVSSIVVMAILARLLPPTDFGLMAIAILVIGLGDLASSLGMGPAIVQKKDLSLEDIQIAHTISVFFGLLVTGAICILTPLLVDYFTFAALENILILLSVTLLFSAFGSIARGLLVREMNFKALFMVDFISYLVGYVVVTVVFALLDFGVYALVFGAICQSFLMLCLLLFFAKPPLRFCYKHAIALRLMSFGAGQSATGFVNYFAANVDYVFIGKYLGASALGLYSRAYHLVTLPIAKISASITGVMFSSYSKNQHKKSQLKRDYLMVVELTSLIIFPILAGFFIGAKWVILGLFGQNWLEAIVPFQILCLAGLFKCVFNLAGSLVQALGFVYAELRRQCVYLVLLGVGCFVAVQWGLEYVAWVVVIASFFLYIMMAQLVLRLVAISWFEFFKSQQAAIVLSALILIVGIVFNRLMLQVEGLPYEISLGLFIVVCAITFIAGFLFLPKALIGTMPNICLDKVQHKMPAILIRYLIRFSPHYSGMY